jgi:hypothetical protein
LVAEDDGAGVGVLAGVVDGVLAGAGAGEDAGVEGAAGVVCSDVLDTVSFFSSALAIGASLSEEGFILSE